MNLALLLNSDDWVPVLILGCVIAVLLGAVVVTMVRERLFPTTVYGRLKRFLGGKDLPAAQTHEKTFPGYDLASVNFALNEFFRESCSIAEQVGSAGGRSLRDLIEAPPDSYLRKGKPSSPAYERLPVDVDEEESFVSHCLWLCELKPPAPGGGDAAVAERFAVLLASSVAYAEFDEDMDAHNARATNLTISVACRDRAVADRFFNELESRRKRLSVYRGKVVDPVVGPGGIRTIGFKRIHDVTERDLILPDAVKRVIHSSIVGFYRHQETLRQIGVEMKRGILFHSPPGTGKTSICQYLAGLLPNFTVCFVSGRRLLYPRELCSMARYLQPTMLVFEDIDLIATERDANGLATVLGELMNQIDGCEPNDQVLFIMNTNSMDRIEQAVRNRPGRVDQIVHLGLPDRDARRKLLAYFARHLAVDEAELDKAADGTEGATPATLKEVVKRAAVNALDRNGSTPPGARITVTGHDLLFAYEQIQFLRPIKVASGEIL